MKEFVYVSDDMLYENPELLDKMVPFNQGLNCRHLMQGAADFMQDYAKVLDYVIEPERSAA